MAQLMVKEMDEKIWLQGKAMFNDLVDLSLYIFSHK